MYVCTCLGFVEARREHWTTILELVTFVSHSVGVGNETHVFWNSSKCSELPIYLFSSGFTSFNLDDGEYLFMLFSFSETLVNFLSSLFTSTLINFQRYILLMFQTLAFSQICCWKMILLYLYLNQWFIWSQFVYNVNCWVGVLLDFCCLSCTSSCFSTLCLVFLLIVHLASFTKVSGTYLFEYLSRFSTLLQWFVWGQSTLYWLP